MTSKTLGITDQETRDKSCNVNYIFYRDHIFLTDISYLTKEKRNILIFSISRVFSSQCIYYLLAIYPYL